MQAFDSAALERAVTDEGTELETRDVRALTEYMTVLSLGGDVYSVTTESGSEYRVDALEARCTCPDKQHTLEDEELCKHERRVRFATGQWSIPSWCDEDAIDGRLGEHTDSATGPIRAVADGGVRTIETEEPDTESTDKGRERPTNCDCHPTFEDLACWPCYHDGFETPNPEVTDNE
jgi:hypothetical protein